METTRLKYNYKVTIVTQGRNGTQTIVRSRVRRVESKTDRFWAEGNEGAYALSQEGTYWVRGWDNEASNRLAAAVKTYNETRAEELREADARDAAARQIEAERQKEESRKREEKERHEREERTVATMKRAWQLVVDAEVPQDLRTTAFQFAITELMPRGWPFMLYR